MLARMREDIQAVLERDPAAYSALQVALTYAGVHAVWWHRVAQWLCTRRLRLLAHMTARWSRWLTGIEIHPAARLGRRLFIDHGMGVVIGETAEVGDDVTIYHGVTLGGVSLAQGKRHPTIEAGVVIGAGAKVLGAITIGSGTRIGANAVVVQTIAAGQVVVGIPGKPVARAEAATRKADFQHDNLPDVLSQRLDLLIARLDSLESDQRGRADDERALAVAEGMSEGDYAI